MLVRLGIMTAAMGAVLAGCADGPPPLAAGAKSAEISFRVADDSVHTTGRNVAISTYPGSDCENRRIVAFKGITARPIEKFGPYAFQADQPLNFEIWYGEARFAENRSCAVRASFVPEPNARYYISFHSVGQVAHCGISIRETGSKQDPQVAAQYPDRTCNQNLKNGQPAYVEWQLHFVPTPAGK